MAIRSNFPEGVEFLQGSLSAGVKRVSEILLQSRIGLKPDQPRRWRRLDEKWAAQMDLKCHSPLRRCHATSRVLRLTGTEVLVKQQQAARRYQKNQNKPERHDQLMRAGSPATKGDH